MYLYKLRQLLIQAANCIQTSKINCEIVVEVENMVVMRLLRILPNSKATKNIISHYKRNLYNKAIELEI